MSADKPSPACMTIAAFYYDKINATDDCVTEWEIWDEYCNGLSSADFKKICKPVEVELADAIKPETMPDEGDDCMTVAAWNYSDDECGRLWKEFDDWCYMVYWTNKQPKASKECDELYDFMYDEFPELDIE